MKLLLLVIYYYYFYTSALIPEKRLTTIIKVDEKTITCYYYDVGYIEWKIINKEVLYQNSEKLTIFKIVYILEHKDMKAIMILGFFTTTYTIMVDGHTDYVKLSRNRDK